ncbi:IclR family transcriptional regulator domain-containing protein [Blastococcus deserti]|uniref:IclR family transcriptional regulator domain-containing protein n=1 Tax=Blastococcus deserti TaxID=2259033 RepID=UPI00366C1195
MLLAEMPVEKVIAMLPEKLEAYTANTITDRTVLLKELEQVREQGFAIIDNELE